MKIITFALASVSFVLNRATAAVAIAPDHVADDIVEELDVLEELDASADMVADVLDGTVYTINFDDIDAGNGYIHKYKRHDMSGVHFTKNRVVHAKLFATSFSLPENYGWSLAASSPPNVAIPFNARMKVHCYRGFLNMKSAKVMPVSYDDDLEPMTIRVRGLRNGKTVAKDEYTLDIKTMTEPMTLYFGDKFNKVSEVVASIDKELKNSWGFTVDDLKFEVVKECKPEPKSDFKVSFDDVRTSKMTGRGGFKKHKHSGVEFVNLVALNGQKMEDLDLDGWSDAVTSPPNFGARINGAFPVQLICPNGFLAMKSVQLMPLSPDGISFKDFEVTIEGFDENNNPVGFKKLVLNIRELDGSFLFNFDDESFDKVREVTFSKPNTDSMMFGMDDIKYKVIEEC